MATTSTLSPLFQLWTEERALGGFQKRRGEKIGVFTLCVTNNDKLGRNCLAYFRRFGYFAFDVNTEKHPSRVLGMGVVLTIGADLSTR